MAVVLVVGVAGAAVADEAPKPYSSAKLGFTATFPYPVKEEGSVVSSANPEDTIAYMVSVIPVSDDAVKQKAPARILSEAVQAAAENVQGKLESSSDVALGAFPGKKFVLSGELGADCRVYLVKNRLFLASVIAKPGLKLPLPAAAFHASFRVAGAK